MSGINQNCVFAIAQIESMFADDIGNSAVGAGTGFFLRTEGGTTAFVTNRHNVDPRLNPRARNIGPAARLRSVSIRLRFHDQAQQTLPVTSLATVALAQTEVRHSTDADVSAFIKPVFPHLPSGLGFNCINARELATQDAIAATVSLADIVTFVGYPGGADGQPWWDTHWHTPVGRLAGLASRPDIPFTNPQIGTADVTLVSGLSFRGSSGSPVILHQKAAAPIGFLISNQPQPSAWTPDCEAR